MTYSAFSGWADRPTDFTPMPEGELTCDIAVIGDGYAGMAAALRLAEHAADVVLSESGFCGRGGSSRNAGYLPNALAGDPQLLNTLYAHRLPGLVRYADEAARFTEWLIGRPAVDCDYVPTGNVIAAVSPGQLRRTERYAGILRRAGADAEFVEGRDFGLPHTFLGGVFERAGGLLNPGKFALGLRAAPSRTASAAGRCRRRSADGRAPAAVSPPARCLLRRRGASGRPARTPGSPP
ncbi:NAD(P)/FAD-dependent oxidoreductase [Streptomyces sp. NPDC021100]|uniref:NAD(P)/FAD-dependent oxidoreductase n=1 Tax=Streptomyces sp. NPDC021100 TaxID=3365114 RepID=UPI00379FAB62